MRRQLDLGRARARVAFQDEFLILLMSLERRGGIVHVRVNVVPSEQKLACYGSFITAVRVGFRRGLRCSKELNSREYQNECLCYNVQRVLNEDAVRKDIS